MPYLSFDLDAMEHCPLVAASCGRTPGAVAWGLLQMWRYCWREEIAVVTELQVGAFFSATDDRGAVLTALEQFSFLERCDEGLKVRGVDKYLRVQKARRDGGKKGRAASTSKRGVSGSTLRSAQGQLKVSSSSPLGSAQALSASSEQRTANSRLESLRKKSAEPETTSEHHDAIRKCSNEFEAAGNGKLAMDGRDGKAIKELLRRGHSAEEIGLRFKRMLALRFPPHRAIYELADTKVWNLCATDNPGADITKGVAPISDFSHVPYGTMVEVKDF